MFVFRHISSKVALIVISILGIVIIAGTIFLVSVQSQSLEDQFKAKGKFLSIIGAKAISRLMEETIDNGMFSLNDAFDTAYLPIPNFDPPKYHTKYDAFTDKAFLSLEDEFLSKDKDILYAMAVDVNGYVPTHNSRFQQPPTGDRKKDLVGNQTKRILNDTVNLKAATNLKEGFEQEILTEGGEKALDFASPIYIKGKHWGNFRVGISLKSLNEAKRILMFKLIGFMVVILIMATVVVYSVVQVSLKPLTEFTQIASRMADGEVDEKIEAKTLDELGDLANVLERMRVSLKAAMDRLMK